MSNAWRDAPEVRDVGLRLIDRYHEHLQGLRVMFAFMEETPNSGGQEVWGRAVKATGRNAYLAQRAILFPGDRDDAFFLVEISEPVWDKLTIEQREALVDHVLHCFVDEDKDGNPKLSILPHDLEEFNVIYQRHGDWREPIRKFLASSPQIGFDQAGLDEGSEVSA